jgi:pSer/pThr/pTyr-binding forkhead associated (FHA) protein
LAHKKTNIIGRSADCDLVIEHSSVSMQHAMLERAGNGRLYLQDLASENGLFLHRSSHWTRADRVCLCRDDLVRLGEHEISPNQFLGLFSAENRVWLPLLAEHLNKAGKNGSQETSTEDAKFNQPRRNPVTGQIEENHS